MTNKEAFKVFGVKATKERTEQIEQGGKIYKIEVWTLEDGNKVYWEKEA